MSATDALGLLHTHTTVVCIPEETETVARELCASLLTKGWTFTCERTQHGWRFTITKGN